MDCPVAPDTQIDRCTKICFKSKISCSHHVLTDIHCIPEALRVCLPHSVSLYAITNKILKHIVDVDLQCVCLFSQCVPLILVTQRCALGHWTSFLLLCEIAVFKLFICIILKPNCDWRCSLLRKFPSLSRKSCAFNKPCECAFFGIMFHSLFWYVSYTTKYLWRRVCCGVFRTRFLLRQTRTYVLFQGLWRPSYKYLFPIRGFLVLSWYFHKLN